MITLCKSEKEMSALQPKQLIRAPEMLSSDTPTGLRWKHIPEREQDE